MTLVKICGITNLTDALTCAHAGADMLGFNFYRKSPRYIAPEEARSIIEQLPEGIINVGVFVNEESPERVAEVANLAGVSTVQLHGDEPPAYCRALPIQFVIKALRVAPDFVPEDAARYETDAILLDRFTAELYGGTGETFDWSKARAARALVPKLFLAGGLNPQNVAEAVRFVRPYAVDACSSLERAPGLKDETRVRAFIVAAKSIMANDEKSALADVKE